MAEPSFPTVLPASSGGVRPRRPTGLTAVCVIAICLGVLGLLTSLAGAVTLIVA